MPSTVHFSPKTFPADAIFLNPQGHFLPCAPYRVILEIAGTTVTLGILPDVLGHKNRPTSCLRHLHSKDCFHGSFSWVRLFIILFTEIHSKEVL
jgi:hypothetical protein